MFTRDLLKTFETDEWKLATYNEANVAYYTRSPEERIDVRWREQGKHDVISVRPNTLQDELILQSLRLSETIRTYATDHSSRRLLYVTGEKKLIFQGISSRDSSPDAFQRVCSDTFIEEIELEMQAFLERVDSHPYHDQQQRFMEDHPDAATILKETFSPECLVVGEKPKRLAEWLNEHGYAKILHPMKKGETQVHLKIAEGENVIRNYLMYFEVVRFLRKKGYVLYNGTPVIASLRRLHERSNR